MKMVDGGGAPRDLMACRLGAPVSDRHRPPEAGERGLAARTDGAPPSASAIRPGGGAWLRPFGPRAGQRPALQAVPVIWRDCIYAATGRRSWPCHPAGSVSTGNQFELGGFGHAVRVPGGIPDEVHADVRNPLDAADLLLDFRGEAARHRAGRRGQRHVHRHLAGVVHVNLVDEAQLVDVHRDLGVVAGLQHIHDLVAQFGPVRGFFGGHPCSSGVTPSGRFPDSVRWPPAGHARRGSRT